MWGKQLATQSIFDLLHNSHSTVPSVRRRVRVVCLVSSFDLCLSVENFDRQKAPRLGCLVCYLAAGTLAAVAAGVSAAQAVAIAAAAEQNCQDDDPPNTATTEAITVTHNRYLRNSRSEHWAHSMVFRRCKKVQAYSM